MRRAESRDADRRKHALDSSRKYITDPLLPPRRIWDLYSNRVIPYYWWGGDLRNCLPVSHSWVAEGERSDTWTSINGRQWAVPIPNDSSLERVRIELLNCQRIGLGYQAQGYSWLDVLCLRQAGEKQDDARRMEEWTTDVPTIGLIYNHNIPTDTLDYEGRAHSTALIYFNGLGRPFRNGGYDDPRHWFSRTWTVQEAVGHPLLGGATPSSPTLFPISNELEFQALRASSHILKREQLQSSLEFQEFYAHFTSAFGEDQYPVFSQYVAMMRKRYATNELDRVSGLASVTQPKRLPIYDAGLSNNDAWEVLVQAIGAQSRAHLFFWYPAAGNTGRSWVPLWSQVMAGDAPAADRNIEGFSGIYFDEAWEEFSGRFRVMDDCSVLGLGLPSPGISSQSSIVRMGSIAFENKRTEGSEQYSVVAHHQVPVDPTARYTLIFPLGFIEEVNGRFVVGMRNSIGEFQKLCVLVLVSQASARWAERFASTERVVLI